MPSNDVIVNIILDGVFISVIYYCIFSLYRTIHSSIEVRKEYKKKEEPKKPEVPSVDSYYK